MINTVAERGEQVVGLLLSTMPLAERMLLYNLAMAAWVMLPGKPFCQVGPPCRFAGKQTSPFPYIRWAVPVSLLRPGGREEEIPNFQIESWATRLLLLQKRKAEEVTG